MSERAAVNTATGGACNEERPLADVCPEALEVATSNLRYWWPHLFNGRVSYEDVAKDMLRGAFPVEHRRRLEEQGQS